MGTDTILKNGYLSTLGTDAVEFHLVGLNLEPELLGNFLLQFFNRLVLELLHGSTAGADKVIMVLAFSNMLVT